MRGNIAIIAIATIALLLGAIYLFAPSKEVPLTVVPGVPSTSATTTTPAAEADQITLRAHINMSAEGLGITILPLEVTEDSRCPMEVQCVWAGTVKVRTTLATPSGVGVQVFELGKTITTETRTITLVEVLPLKRTTNTAPVSNYEFIFEVKKRTDL